MLAWLGFTARTPWVYRRASCVSHPPFSSLPIDFHVTLQQGQCCSVTLAPGFRSQLSSLWKFQKQVLCLFNIRNLKYRLKSHILNCHNVINVVYNLTFNAIKHFQQWWKKPQFQLWIMWKTWKIFSSLWVIDLFRGNKDRRKNSL